MFILFCCVTYNTTVHGADLTYISLLVIFCIIVYVMNTNLESLNMELTTPSHNHICKSSDFPIKLGRKHITVSLIVLASYLIRKIY